MMTPRQVEYELDYWRKTDREKNDARQRKILDLWGFTGADSVLEVGTGPWGGCLPFVKADWLIACDPLIPRYVSDGLIEWSSLIGCLWSDSTIEECVCDELLELGISAILSMNTLDHGDSDFKAIDAIARLLEPGGRFYLHVNLRTPEQLNEGHDHALKLEDLQTAIERNGLKEIKCDVYDHDPVEWAPYKTVIGIWER